MLTVADLVADINEGTENAFFEFAEFEVFNDELYFAANDGSNGRELWKTDGTPDGTELVSDIFGGDREKSSNPGLFVEFRDELYFTAIDGAGDELWKTDGTGSGTQLVIDIFPGVESSTPETLFPFGDQLLFSAEGPGSGDELWISDGTTNGTRLLKDISDGTSSAQPASYSGFFEFNGKVYFDGTTDQGVELWRTDGTEAGTEIVIDSNPGFADGWPTNLFEFKGDLYFTSETFEEDDSFGHIYRVDGATGQASRAFDVPANWREPILVQDDTFYFAGFEEVNGEELYRSDGTPEGTFAVRDIMRGINDSKPRNLTAWNDKVYFAAGGELDSEQRLIYRLWVTDGTLQGTRQVSSEEIYADSKMIGYEGELYYTGLSEDLGWELFRTDGGSAGTVVQDINPDENNSFALPKTVFNDKLYFLADNLTAGWEIWEWDGDAATMVNVHIGGGDIAEDPETFEFFRFGNDLVFVGSTPFEGRELFAIRGPETVDRLAGDANEDGEVSVNDFLILSRNFGAQNADWSMGDFNEDGKVDVGDFLVLSRNFGAKREAAAVDAAASDESATPTRARAVDAAIATLAAEDESDEDQPVA